MIRIRIISELPQGRFPSDWKMATLVLLQKERNPRTLHRSIRFACDLDELSKLFKRISCSGFPYPGLVSTYMMINMASKGEILRVCSLSDQYVEEEVAMVVSLDIVNAFKSIPREAIEKPWNIMPSHISPGGLGVDG